MSTNPLHPGIGFSFHDDNIHAAVVAMSTGRIPRPGEPQPVVSRDFSGKMLPNETVGHAVGRILKNYVGHTPEYVGVSTHHENIDRSSWRQFAGTPVEAVDPTAATLMGLEHVKRNPDRMLIQKGSTPGGAKALLKIGPDSVTWIVDGESEGQVLSTDTIRRFTPAADDFAAGMNASRHTNPVQLLGNLGWVNAARHLNLAGPEHAGGKTKNLMDEALKGDRKSRRALVAHFGWLAPRVEFMHPEKDAGELFAAKVASFMIENIGRSIGRVYAEASQLQQVGTLFVQCNAISSSKDLRNWAIAPLRRAISRNGEVAADVVLVEPRPQMAEAYGAILLAGQKVGATA